jgi:hypothetical protein
MDNFDNAMKEMCEALDDLSEDDTTELPTEQNYYDPKCEFFGQYALIVGRDGGIPICVVYVMSRLNWWFNDIMTPLLKKYRAIYYKYGPQLADAYHCKLISNPIEYTGTAIRTIPILNLQGYGGGLLLLNSDPPLFSDRFLSEYRPALVNICILTNKPVQFFYKIGFRTRGVLRSGYVKSSDYTALPPYTPEEIQSRGIVDDDIPIETILPGRYFIDLQLELGINPVLFAENLFHIDDLLFVASYHLMWQDAGDHLEPSLIQDIKVILDNFTHVIAQFKTTPAALVDEDIYGTSLKDARKFSVITLPSANIVPQRDLRIVLAETVADYNEGDIIADDLLGD